MHFKRENMCVDEKKYKNNNNIAQVESIEPQKKRVKLNKRRKKSVLHSHKH